MTAAVKLQTVRAVLTGKDRSWIRSGLNPYTLFHYRTDEGLERDGEGVPVYFHLAGCNRSCGHVCNGNRGTLIARDVDALEGKFKARKARPRKLRPTVREWLIFKYTRESGIRELFYRWTDDIRPAAMTKSWGYVYWQNGGDKYCAHG